jgi:hypothetical protein
LTDKVQSKELQDVKDYSFLQIFHHVFFDSSDRTNFMYLIAKYHEISNHAFDKYLDLRGDIYLLFHWTYKLNKRSPVYTFFMRSAHCKSRRYINDILTLIRNTYTSAFQG